NELKMVDYVRDRFLCDVHVIMNVQFNGGGGESTTLSFLGQNQFAGLKDTLNYFNNAVATEDQKRKKMLQHLKLGLIQFISKSPLAEKIEINYLADESENKVQQKNDPWNFWQFSIGGSGFFNGDRNFKSQSVYAYINSGRETEKTRFSFNISNNINRSKYSIYYKNNEGVDTSEIVKVTRDEQNVFGRYVVKMTDHWGAGLRTSFSRSVFQNIDSRFDLAAMVEYSLFPYKEFNTQRVVVFAELGPQYSNYGDTTIYFKTSEFLFQQSAGITTSFTKPWGSINLGTYFSAYLDDVTKNSLFIGGGVEWNIFKGFRFGVGGNIQFIHNQISIPKESASRDDVLTQRRIIASTYDYFMGVGFSYTFGSIFNSQVNPTFKGLNYSLNF
ncbi:MAG: hypothetical protein H7X99_01330, partial [Saprospiraceae bacterium]|nr:hypothetical protein [Saprospiraceae bacterium]